MHAIFYDLETSDKYTIGQILNFSFITVDEHYSIIDEYNGRVKINRLQLPSPAAILANRIDVTRHQQEAELSEKEAAIGIYEYIAKQLSVNEKTSLIGFNSSRFDLPFLRTTLMRNGINPYFFGKLLYRDLLQLARKLSLQRADFPRKESYKSSLEEGKKEEPRLSLSLETLCNEFGVLKGKQAHSSREDVRLTISLAKLFKQLYSADVMDYQGYEAAQLHSRSNYGKVYNLLSPNYDLNSQEISIAVPCCLLDFDYRSALWIDLERYLKGEGQKSISWYSVHTGSFITDKKSLEDQALLSVAQEALSEFKKINLKNFFKKSDCDIEQDIYRLDITMLDKLKDAIWQGKEESVKNILTQDAKIILLRHKLANYSWGGGQDEIVKEKLRQYAVYRYEGKLKLNKFDDADKAPAYHPKLKDYLVEMDSLSQDTDAESLALLMSLKNFYLNSEILNICEDLKHDFF